MGTNDKKINVVIGAEDKTRAAFASATTQLDNFARSVAGLPLSLPETTGVPRPMTGGVLAEPEKAAA